MSPLGNCPECGGDQPFEQIHPGECPDIDSGECPEWLCVACGAAVIMGTVVGTAVASSAIAGTAVASTAIAGTAARAPVRAA